MLAGPRFKCDNGFLLFCLNGCAVACHLNGLLVLDNAFPPQARTNAGAGKKGWPLYRFDISRAGGKAGTWRFIGRVINPSNHSDWLWVLGDDGDKIPQDTPAFFRPEHIIFEENVPAWAWMRTGDFGKDGGTMIWTRQSSLQVQYDIFVRSSDLEYQPTDEDYDKADEKTLPVAPAGTWRRLKQSSAVVSLHPERRGLTLLDSRCSNR